MRIAKSMDGTRIAYDRLGSGPAVILVSGMFCDRDTMRPLAEALARRFTVINYDRRVRGGSSDMPPYAVEREIEDLAVLIDKAGGAASVYGHSSGAGLALAAAAAGLPITRLVLHEPPYGSDDEESRESARALAEDVAAALAEDRRADAIGLFFEAAGMPPEMVAELSGDPRRQAVAPTMPYDFAVMGDIERGGAIPEHLVRAIGIPTLVIAGEASPDFFKEAAARIVQFLPDGTYAELEGADHGAPAGAVAPAVAAFLQA